MDGGTTSFSVAKGIQKECRWYVRDFCTNARIEEVPRRNKKDKRDDDGKSAQEEIQVDKPWTMVEGTNDGDAAA